MADNHLADDVLGVSWDGTGQGLDGSIWGGEFFAISGGRASRVGTFRSFTLPGGATAVKEPRRSALGLLHELYGEENDLPFDLPPTKAFRETELRVIRSMLRNGLNSPRTSSVGRLFDAVAALLDIRQTTNFEGQAAMELEFRSDGSEPGVYPFGLVRTDGVEAAGDSSKLDIVDWAPMIRGMLEDRRAGVPTRLVAGRFHRTLGAIVVAVARRHSFRRVVLSGGCFQNRLLTESTVRSLREAGFQPYWHQRIPPNDGGIALGQLVAESMTWDDPLRGKKRWEMEEVEEHVAERG
jgi:hydrogenase maturation protein HypF